MKSIRLLLLIVAMTDECIVYNSMLEV